MTREVSVIENSRSLAENDFVFFDRVVIRDEALWKLFNYISEVSNIKITRMDSGNIVSGRSTYNNPIAIRIDRK